MSLRESKLEKDPSNKHRFSSLHFFTGVRVAEEPVRHSLELLAGLSQVLWKD